MTAKTVKKTEKHQQIVWGTDPEYFAGYKKNGELFVLPAAFFRTHLEVPFIPDGRHPIFIDRMEDLGTVVMEDGVAFEATIRPDTDWKALFERIQIGKRLLSEQILSKFPDYCLPEVLTVPTIGYEVDRWIHEDREFQDCNIFGCDQDWDAWNHNAAGKVIDALKHDKRYGGGHLHISGVPFFKIDPVAAVKAMSITIGCAAVAFSDVPELDKARTFTYGRPGKYRFQTYKSQFNGIPDTEYGIEYRTPSNRWTNSISHMEQIVNWAKFCVEVLLEGGKHEQAVKKFGKDAKKAILECDQPLAKEILSQLEVMA